MKYSIIFTTVITLGLIGQPALAEDITDTYQTDDKLTVTTMNNIKTAVNSKLDDAANTVNSAHIVNGAVTGSDIAAGTITSSNIATGTITGSDIASSTIPSTDIQNEAGADSGVYNFHNFSDMAVCSSWSDVRSVTIVPPASGRVLVIATGFGNPSVAAVYYKIGIDDVSTGTTVDTPNGGHLFEASSTTGAQERKDFAVSHTYTVTGGVSKTFYLKACRESTALIGDWLQVDNIAAIYYPTTY